MADNYNWDNVTESIDNLRKYASTSEKPWGPDEDYNPFKNDPNSTLSVYTNTAVGGWGVSVKTSVDSAVNKYYTQPTQSLYNAAASSVEASSHLIAAGKNLYNAFTDGTQYANLADAAGSAALNIIYDKLEQLRSLFTATDTITVGSLVELVGGWCQDVPGAGKLVVNQLNTLLSKLLSVTTGETFADTFKNFGLEYLEDILSDSTVIEAASDLSLVKSAAEVLNTVSSIYNTVTSLLSAIEPVMPYIDIMVSTAALWINPTEAANIPNKSATLAQTTLQRLIAQLLKDLKEFIYPIEFAVPKIVTMSLDALDTNGLSTTNWSSTDSSGYIYKVLLDSTYANNFINSTGSIGYTRDSILEGLSTLQKISNAQFGTLDSNNRYLKAAASSVSDFMNNAISNAKKKSYVPDSSNYDFTSFEDVLEYIQACTEVSIDNLISNGCYDAELTDLGNSYNTVEQIVEYLDITSDKTLVDNYINYGFVDSTTGETVVFPYRGQLLQNEKVNATNLGLTASNDFIGTLFEFQDGYLYPKDSFNLNYVTLSHTLTSITTLKSGFLKDNQTIISFNIGSAITKIEDEAFANSTLETIKLSNNLTEIGSNVFCNSNITSCYIPKSVQKVGNNNFEGCGLAYIEVEASESEIKALIDSGNWQSDWNSNIPVIYGVVLEEDNDEEVITTTPTITSSKKLINNLNDIIVQSRAILDNM